MGITISRPVLLATLEAAVSLAESKETLPTEWIDKARRIGESPSKSYVAAFGTALLAKASDPNVDALSVKAGSGPDAYSMRGVVAVLVERRGHFGYDLGVNGPEPLNNQPWLGMNRVDEPDIGIKPNARPFLRDLVRYLRDLNKLTHGGAVLAALAAFLRERLAVAAAQRAVTASFTVDEGLTYRDLVKATETFVTENPEGGRRGQALVAALFDLLHDDVRLLPINHPGGLDVSVLRDGAVVLGAEVKQKIVDESTAAHLIDEAREAGATKALLVAIGKGQRRLDMNSVREMSSHQREVLSDAHVSVEELFRSVVLHSPYTLTEVVAVLPKLYLHRMQEHGVSDQGLQDWIDAFDDVRVKRS